MRPMSMMTVQFIPATPTKDDPLGQRGFFTWKAIIDGKQFGMVHELDGSPKEMAPDQYKKWTLVALDEAEKVRRMTAEQMAELDAKVPA